MVERAGERIERVWGRVVGWREGRERQGGEGREGREAGWREWREGGERVEVERGRAWRITD